MREPATLRRACDSGRRHRAGRALAGAALALQQAGVHAAVGRAGGAATAPDPIDMSSLVQLTLGLLAVLAAIVVVAWLMRRVGRFQSGAGGALRILGGLSMGARERVVLVQVGDKQLLLGVAPGRVQTLHVLDEPLAGSQDREQTGRFAEKLRAALDKRSGS
ncbi:MAG TPA: flagellar biosynthetic protein FliO [Gammaproteobacteria bacterium]|nr:flagellar biosynthetic protein FliO [Gammaproteobacteria bacterium]